jgi:hypothetical protein
MFKRFLIFTSFLALAACADITDGQIQDVTIETPGAQGAVCYMYVDIPKSGQDLEVDCLAPGGRRQQVFVESKILNAVYGNVVTGVVPGTAWDFGSNAAFKYPGVITVDFTHAPIVPEALPAHNNPDIKQPEEYMLEEFRPETPRLNSDRFNVPTEIQRRQSMSSIEVERNYIVQEPIGRAMDKGDLVDVINNLGAENMDPAAAPAEEAPASESSTSGKRGFNFEEGQFRRNIFDKGLEENPDGTTVPVKEGETTTEETTTTTTKKTYTSKTKTAPADSAPTPLVP